MDLIYRTDSSVGIQEVHQTTSLQHTKEHRFLDTPRAHADMVGLLCGLLRSGEAMKGT